MRGLNATHASPFEGRGGSFSESRHTDTPHRYATQIRHTDTPHTRRIQSGSSGAFGSGPWGPSRSSGPSGSGTSVRHQWAHHDSRFTIVQGLFFSHPHQHNTLTHTTRVWWCVPREHRSAYYSGSIPSGPSGPSDPSGPSGSSGPSRPSGSSGPSGPSCFFWGGQ